MWATNLQRQFTKYLEDAEKNLNIKIEEIISEKSSMYHLKWCNKQSLYIVPACVSTGKEDKLDQSKRTLDIIALEREELQSTVAKGKQKVHTRVWKVFEKSYQLDLQVMFLLYYLTCTVEYHELSRLSIARVP